MIFDSSFWPMSLLFGAIGAVIVFILSLASTEKRSSAFTLTLAGINFVVVLLLTRIMFYYGMPSFIGVLGGLWWPITLISVPSLAFGLFGFEHRGRTVGLSITAALLAILVIPVFQFAYSSWGPNNAQRYAKLAQITINKDPEAVIPPTDPNTMVQVSQAVAAFKGQTALTSDKTQNLGSRFRVNQDAYVLQAVGGHRYWIAPLEFANFGDDTWAPLTGSLPESPGYVVVDAQNPFKDAWVKLDYQMTIFKNGSFGANLQRLLYKAGYDNLELYEEKFEVDEQWNPHWVVTFVNYPFEGVAGRVVEKIVVVDVAKSEPKIAEYELGKQPEWVERAMPQGLIADYLQDWGYYDNNFARQNKWNAYFGWKKYESTQPAEYDLNYTSEHHSVWVVPMSSMNNSDHAVTGVVVYETTTNKATFYPGIRGFNEGETVKETIAHAPVFLGKNLGVEQPQLYMIYDNLTWVSVITNPQSTGSGYAGIALLHAKGQNASEVIFAPDMNRALGQYANQLANKDSGDLKDVSQRSNIKSHKGRVLGVGVIPGNTQNPNQWVFMVEGDARTFTIGRETYGKIPMVKEGDIITFSYLEIAGNELAVASFSCERLDGTAAKQVEAPKLQPEKQ